MKNLISSVFIALGLLLIASSCSKKTISEADYPIQPVPFTSVRVSDNFWAPRIKNNAGITIPIAFEYCESTGRVKNFDIAAGTDTGKFQTIFPFDDSDVYKIKVKLNKEFSAGIYEWIVD